MEGAVKPILSIMTALVGVAIISVIVSKKSATSEVIQSASNAFTEALKVAVSPITVSN